MRKFLHVTLLLIMSILTLWCAGFLWFNTYVVQDAASQTIPKADAIVVLTGDQGRIEEGFYLFSTGRAPHLYISGVNKGVSREGLIQTWQGAPLPLCCVDLGYEAKNTWGNAQESAAWFKKNNIKSIFLVTSDYHMPRAQVEFSFAAPEVIVYPHPVHPDSEQSKDWKSLRLLIGEYHKTIATYIRNILNLGDL